MCKFIFISLIICIATVYSPPAFSAQSVYQRQLKAAIENGDIVTAKSMIAKGATVKNVIPQYSLVQQPPSIIKFLLDSGYTINDPASLYNDLFNLGNSHYYEKITLFIQKNIPLSKRNQYGQTVLHSVTSTLFEPRVFGSSPQKSQDMNKAYALLLSKTQESLNTTSPDGGLNHSYACRPIDIVYGMYRVRNSVVAKNLLKAGTDPNMCSGPQKRTPLMNAVDYGDKEMVEFLLEYRVAPNTSCQGLTALDLVQKQNSTDQALLDIEFMLIEQGAKTHIELAKTVQNSEGAALPQQQAKNGSLKNTSHASFPQSQEKRRELVPSPPNGAYTVTFPIRNNVTLSNVILSDMQTIVEIETPQTGGFTIYQPGHQYAFYLQDDSGKIYPMIQKDISWSKERNATIIQLYFNRLQSRSFNLIEGQSGKNGWHCIDVTIP